jgi:outer membrane protein assembly factor BamA
VDPLLDAFEDQGKVALSKLFTNWFLDFRNNSILPSRGSLQEVRLELANQAMGGELSFHQITARSSWLVPLEDREEWILAFGARGGLIVRQGRTDIIPIQYRLFNGGEDSVRSFRQDELGPKIGGDPVGGEFFSTGNLELRFPLSGPLRGTLFADGGNVRLRRSEAGFHDYRYALGMGLRYHLPIGPIRLDWGWNPNRRSDEDLWALHLSVGFPF